MRVYHQPVPIFPPSLFCAAQLPACLPASSWWDSATLSPPVIRPGRRFKGIVHPKVIFHPFITYACLTGAVFSNSCNHSGVSETERIYIQ